MSPARAEPDLRRFLQLASDWEAPLVRVFGGDLEPHLAQAGRYGGFSGPEGFTLAARSLKLILNELGVPWR
jgi:hypothetical protein